MYMAKQNLSGDYICVSLQLECASWCPQVTPTSQNSCFKQNAVQFFLSLLIINCVLLWHTSSCMLTVTLIFHFCNLNKEQKITWLPFGACNKGFVNDTLIDNRRHEHFHYDNVAPVVMLVCSTYSYIRPSVTVSHVTKLGPGRSLLK